MEIKLARWMLKYVANVINKYRNKGLSLQKYSKLSGEVSYKLEWCDCG